MSTKTYYSEKLGQNLRLGRIVPKSKPLTLKLKSYLLEGVAAPPESVDYFTKAMPSLREMLGNDRWGNCVIAGELHALGGYSANDKDSGGIRIANTEETVAQYKAICGPGDNGCVITHVLDHHVSKGLRIGSEVHKIDGYLAIDNTNKIEVQIALYLFGPLSIGLLLPSSWMNSSDGDIWDTTNWPIIGGHEVVAMGYDAQGVTISTWGGLRKITWAAFTSSRWLDEVYLKLAPLWYGPDKIAPNQVDVEKLKSDLQKFKDGILPSVEPTPTPPPVPPTPPTPPTPPKPQELTGVGKAVAAYKDFFGRSQTMELELTQLDLQVLQKQQYRLPVASHADALEGLQFDWALVLKIATAAVTTVISDLQAGKTPAQIIENTIAAVLAVLNGKSTDECEAKMVGLDNIDWMLVIKISLAVSAVLIAGIRAGKSPAEIAKEIAMAVIAIIG
jgi:hypothetical protein